jgi:hypothetical protein
MSPGRWLLFFHEQRGLRAIHNSKTHPAGFRATTQLTRLVLSDTSILRKRHESVMSIVMGVIPNRDLDMKKRLDFLIQVDFHVQSNSAHLQCLDLAYHNLDRYALAQYHSKHNVSISIRKKVPRAGFETHCSPRFADILFVLKKRLYRSLSFALSRCQSLVSLSVLLLGCCQ